MQRLGGAKTTDLDTICGGGHREDCKTPVNADEATAVGGGGRLMTALGMEVGRLNVETDVPAVTVPGDGGKQNPRSRCDLPFVGGQVDVVDRPK
jgi:hypothetical protein